MKKRQVRKQETRETIRQCAKSLFQTKGFEATTSRQIAEAAGIAVGTIFVHFESKSAILVDILYEDIEERVSVAFATLPMGAETAVQLLHIAGVLYGYYLEHIELSRVLLQHNLLQPAGQADFKQQIEQFQVALTAVLVQGQVRGDVVATKDSGTMAYLFIAAYFFVLVGLVREDVPDLAEGLGRLAELTQVIVV